MKVSFFKSNFFFIFILLVINILQSYLTPLVDDEAYYWMWSKQLDFGYFDHPPMIALWIKIGYSIFNNELGVRLLSCVFNAFAFWFWLQILQPKSDNEKTWFWLLAVSIIIFQVVGFLATPDAALFFFGSFYCFALYRFLQRNSWLNILLLALAMALAMYSKYHALLLILFSTIFIYRKTYFNYKFWISVLVAIFLFAPHLIWQFQHDFISLKYHFFHRNDHTIWKFSMFTNYILGLLFVGNIFIIYHIFKYLHFKPENDFLKAMRNTALATLLFFFLFSFRTQVQAQWNLIIYLTLFPLLYQFGKTDFPTKYLKISSIFTICIILIIRVLIMIPTIPTPMQKLKKFVFEAQEVSSGIPVFERYQKAAAYTFYTHENAECLTMYNHRKSQYDLWRKSIENRLSGNEITFFGMEKLAEDSLIDEDGKTVFYKVVESYQKYPQIEIFRKVKDKIVVENNEFSDEIIIQNNEEKQLDFSKESAFSLGIIVMNNDNHPTWFFPLEEKISLKANEKSETVTTVKANLLKGKYNAYYCLRPKEISGILLSEPFEINVE